MEISRRGPWGERSSGVWFERHTYKGHLSVLKNHILNVRIESTAWVSVPRRVGQKRTGETVGNTNHPNHDALLYFYGGGERNRFTRKFTVSCVCSLLYYTLAQNRELDPSGHVYIDGQGLTGTRYDLHLPKMLLFVRHCIHTRPGVGI